MSDENAGLLLTFGHALEADARSSPRLVNRKQCAGDGLVKSWPPTREPSSRVSIVLRSAMGSRPLVRGLS